MKKFLFAVMNEQLAPIRERRLAWEKRTPEIVEILKAGSIEARKAAAQTLSEVKKAMRIDYFEDEEWVKGEVL